MINRGIFSGILVLFFIWNIDAAGANERIYRTAGDSYVTITGTSTLHDWEMRSGSPEGEAVFNFGDDGNPVSLDEINFKLSKVSLKSDKNSLDKKAYEAMNSERYPEIFFRANGNSNIEKDGDKYSINARGNLTISGVTRNINVDATCINNGEVLVCSGSRKLKMTDFDIDPPVMMLGALRTGDEITVSYHIVYRR